MQHDSIHDRRHPELANAVVQIVASTAGADGSRAAPHREIGASEISRAADQLRQDRRDSFQDVLRRLARRHCLRLLVHLRHERVHVSTKDLGQLAFHTTFKLGGFQRMRMRICGELAFPLRFGDPACSASVPCLVYMRWDLERCVWPGERRPRRRDFLLAERGTVSFVSARFVGRALRNHGPAANERGFVSHRASGADRVYPPPRCRVHRRSG